MKGVKRLHFKRGYEIGSNIKYNIKRVFWTSIGFIVGFMMS